MRAGEPSRTALGAAGHRAAHQVLEGGRIFSDPLAARILGAEAGQALARAQADPSRRRLRLFIAARARIAEDALADAIARGTRQLVVLGAGLDTFAYRAALPDGFFVFEVDHPATQAWKRERLAEAGIAAPAALRFAPVDFERQTLADGLASAGFDPGRSSFFTWLGVVPYLTEAAVFATLGFVAGLPGGAELVFDYGNPPDGSGAMARLAARVAAAGEIFHSFFETDELHARLAALGFRVVVDVGPPEMAARFFAAATAPPPSRGGHILHVATRVPG